MASWILLILTILNHINIPILNFEVRLCWTFFPSELPLPPWVSHNYNCKFLNPWLKATNSAFLNYISFHTVNISPLCVIERFLDRLPLMTHGLKLSLEAWILKFNNLRFNELQLHFGNSIFTLMMTWGLKNCFVLCMYVVYKLPPHKIFGGPSNNAQ